MTMLHRIKPDIQIVTGIDKIEELTPDFWKKYLEKFAENIVLAPKYAHETSYIGEDALPLKQKKDG